MSRIRASWFSGAVGLAAVAVMGSHPLAAGASGWQVDVKYGQSTLDDAFEADRVNAFDDESDTAGVEVGYLFNDYIGLQAGYHDLGTFQGFGSFCRNSDEPCLARLAQLPCVEGGFCLYAALPLEAEVTGWSLAAVPSWPFTERLSAYGKVGFLDWESEVSTRAAFGLGTELERLSETDLLTALGVRYRFGKSLGALLEYQKIDLDLGSATLGVSWKF